MSIGFILPLFLVFLILKLCGVIDWSYWWITSPVWISVVIFCVILFLSALRTIKRRRRQ